MFEYTLLRICPLEEGSLKLGLPPSGLPPSPSMSPAHHSPSLLTPQASVQLMPAGKSPHTGLHAQVRQRTRYTKSACRHPDDCLDQHDTGCKPLHQPASRVQARGPK